MKLMDQVLQSLDTAHGVFLSQFKDVPPEKLATSLPGAPNHFLWTLGHITGSYSFFASAFGSTVPNLPEDHTKLFGMGAKPVPDLSVYPPLAELQNFCDRQYQALRAAAAAMPESEYYQPSPNGMGFITTKLDALLILINHEGWHTGQLASLRKGLGLPSIWGM